MADDHEWIRNILVALIEQTLPQAEVVITENGLDAFEAFQAGGADFLVTNHQMPLMNGMELIQRVRMQRPDLPILMVSVKPEAKKDAMAAGASWFLSKAQIPEQMPPLLRQYADGRQTPPTWEHD